MIKAQDASETSTPNILTIIKGAIYYDGYNSRIFDRDAEDGILRHSNDIYAVPLTDEQLDQLGTDLKLKVTLAPLCDNYDRVGNVNIALVPKGQGTYEYDKVERIEVGRYISPFMNKIKKPKQVPYEYDLPNLSLLLRDPQLREKYDFWLESVFFGVPYAANSQIAGCSGRNDVYKATVEFETNATPAGNSKDNVLIPIYAKAPEVKGPVNLNNYREAATDTLGVTTRTFEFEVPTDLSDAVLTLITTSHGAGDNGEEYVRRQHLIYLDGEIVESFRPGGISCEPYRQYNTQGNGIYGSKPREDWEEWSNWCPGQAIPVRYINLGALKAGKHKFMIRVPEARFFGNDGDIRPSLYVQGMTEGSLPAGIDQIAQRGPKVEFFRNGNILSFSSEERITRMTVHSFDGSLVYGLMNPSQLDLSKFGSGAYILTLFTADGRSTFTKIVK